MFPFNVISKKAEEVKKTNNWMQGFNDYLNEKISDVFFIYFLTFEILYNWKFFYTLIVGDSSKSQQIISESIHYISIPSYFIWVNNFLGNPSPMTLSLLSATFMTIFYPLIHFFFAYVRKIVLYYTNSKISSDFPSRVEYEMLKNDVLRLREESKAIKGSRISDIVNLGYSLIKENLLVRKDKLHYAVVLGAERSIFENDELVRISNRNSAIIEKLDPTSSMANELYIVVQKITSDIYLVAKLASEIPLSKAMIESGQEYFIITHLGHPAYISRDNLHKMMNQPIKNYIYYGQIKKNSELISISKA